MYSGFAVSEDVGCAGQVVKEPRGIFALLGKGNVVAPGRHANASPCRKATSPSCCRSPNFPLARCAWAITDETLKETLHKAGLARPRDRLGETERWDHILSDGEKQRAAFARVLIHTPAGVLRCKLLDWGR